MKTEYKYYLFSSGTKGSKQCDDRKGGCLWCYLSCEHTPRAHCTAPLARPRRSHRHCYLDIASARVSRAECCMSLATHEHTQQYTNGTIHREARTALVPTPWHKQPRRRRRRQSGYECVPFRTASPLQTRPTDGSGLLQLRVLKRTPG